MKQKKKQVKNVNSIKYKIQQQQICLKQDKYKPPLNVNEEEDEDRKENEEEQKVVKKNKKQKKQKQQQDDKDKPEEIHPDDAYNNKKYLHPISILFTFLFKVLAAVMYVFGMILFENKIIFISVVLLISFDFWTVKNISGRLLVGLRWWSDFDRDGNEVWRFECIGNFQPNIVNKSLFWTSLYATTIFWLFFLFFNVISFSFYWGIIDIIGFTLSSVNLFGYYKCSGDWLFLSIFLSRVGRIL